MAVGEEFGSQEVAESMIFFVEVEDRGVWHA